MGEYEVVEVDWGMVRWLEDAERAEEWLFGASSADCDEG